MLLRLRDLVSCFYFAVVIRAELFPIEPRYSLVENSAVVRDSPGSIWPKPDKITTFWTRKYLNSNYFVLSSHAVGCDVISEALERYNKLFFMDGRSEILDGGSDPLADPLVELKVVVDQHDTGLGHCSYPQLGDDETYSIRITPVKDVAEIHSATVWGALRALETFSQLIYFDQREKTYFVNDTIINDRPAYTHRGIMMDTSRHYYPVYIIKSNLDAMAYNKFNVFHWHIVDDQSFPFQSRKFPNLSLLGAYTQSHIYTYDDINEIIEFARLRGIRVIPEFDSPSHTHSIGNAFPNLITPCYFDGKPNVANDIEYSKDEVLNPILEETYKFVDDILREFRGLFKDQFVHLGMDETNLNCWNSNPDILKFMGDRGMSSTMQLHEYYSQRVLNITEDIGYKYMIWEDPLEEGVNVHPDTVIEVWKPDWFGRANDIVKKGHRIVLSSCWYLNLISYGPDWINYYACDPREFFVDPVDREKVIGGEACMWSEYIDKNNFLSTLWPRASAVAERLWHNATALTAGEAIYRLHRHRCRMLRRGIPTRPLINGFCGEFETQNEQDVPTTIYSIVLKNVPRHMEVTLILPILSMLIVILLIFKYGFRRVRFSTVHFINTLRRNN